MKSEIHLHPLFALAELALLPGIRAVRNDAAQSIEALQNRLLELRDDANTIVARADAEKRGLTEEENDDVVKITNAFAGVEAEIANRESVMAMNSTTSTVLPRKTNAELTDNAATTGAAATTNTAAPQAVSRTAVRNSVAPQPRQEDTGRWGFRSAAEFLTAVKNAGGRGAVPDPRLLLNAAPGQYGSEGTGADGGFAVPPDFRTAIMTKVMGEDSLLSLTDQQITSGSSISFPADETTPWQQSGGIQAYWESEGGLKTPSKPAFTGKLIKLNKVIALVPLTDELLEDAPAMSSYVNRKAPEKINFKINAAIISGTGVGMPLGILNSPGTIVVPEANSQAADTIVFANILAMYSALTPMARRNAKWLMNPDCEQQLMSMQFPGTGTAVPAYLPPGGLSVAPFGTLLGRPIIVSEAMLPLGTVGDIIFGDLQNYLSVTKAGGIRSDVSIHIWFDYDITAFRFVLRVGGEPWWNAPIAPYNAGSTSRGFFATLATRA